MKRESHDDAKRMKAKAEAQKKLKEAKENATMEQLKVVKHKTTS